MSELPHQETGNTGLSRPSLRHSRPKEMPLAAKFPGRPDVLDLIITTEASAEFSIDPMDSAFGESEAQVFCYRGIPLGMVAELMPYHKALGSFGDESVLVLLAPALRPSIPFPEITPSSFSEVFSQFLSRSGTDWTLICERDCDQEPIAHLQASTSEAQNRLDELFRFLDGRPGEKCPTFIMSKTRLGSPLP